MYKGILVAITLSLIMVVGVVTPAFADKYDFETFVKDTLEDAGLDYEYKQFKKVDAKYKNYIKKSFDKEFKNLSLASIIAQGDKKVDKICNGFGEMIYSDMTNWFSTELEKSEAAQGATIMKGFCKVILVQQATDLAEPLIKQKIIKEHKEKREIKAEKQRIIEKSFVDKTTKFMKDEGYYNFECIEFSNVRYQDEAFRCMMVQDRNEIKEQKDEIRKEKDDFKKLIVSMGYTHSESKQCNMRILNATDCTMKLDKVRNDKKEAEEKYFNQAFNLYKTLGLSDEKATICAVDLGVTGAPAQTCLPYLASYKKPVTSAFDESYNLCSIERNKYTTQCMIEQSQSCKDFRLTSGSTRVCGTDDLKEFYQTYEHKIVHKTWKWILR